MQITKTKKKGAEVILSGSLPSEDIRKHYDSAVKAAVKEVSLPGFRKGHVPEERVIEEVGKDFLWKDAAERALKEKLADILKQEGVASIAPLSLSLKSPKHWADVAFEIMAIMPPTVSIENYTDAAKKALDALPAVEKEKEVADAKRAFRTQVRAISMMKVPENVTEGDAAKNEANADEPLTDEEAKAVGFENAGAIEHFIDGEAEKAVADKTMQRMRGAVAEALITAATADIPKVLVEEESHALLEMFKKDVAAQGLAWSEYLKRVGKTEDAVRHDLAPNAEKRIVLDLVFGHIIREEKLELSEEDKKKEEALAHKLLEQGVPHERAHNYARESFMREKVWGVLGVKSEAVV